MKSKYKNEREIEELVKSFEDATVLRGNWRHAEHLVVALYYLARHDTETATKKMRNGIFGLLAAFKVDLTKEMPYHETLTVFWMRTVHEYILMNKTLSLVEMADGLCSRFDKDHPLKFYSRELLFSDRARAEYVEPDTNPFDSALIRL